MSCYLLSDIRSDSKNYFKINVINDNEIEYEFSIDHLEDKIYKRLINIFYPKNIKFYITCVFDLEDASVVIDFLRRVVPNFDVYNVVQETYNGFIIIMKKFQFYRFSLNDKLEYLKTGVIVRDVKFTGYRKLKDE